MSLTPISQIRRRELITAALEVLKNQGVAGATLEKVAEQAGASKGIVLHYFGNKQSLFEEVMRFANAELRREVVRRMELAQTPVDRLWAIVSGNFTPAFYSSQTSHAWLVLCAEVPREEQFRRLQTVIHARMHSNLVSALRELIPAEEVDAFAVSISSMIDGLWLRLAINPAAIDREMAIRIMLELIRDRIADFTPSDIMG